MSRIDWRCRGVNNAGLIDFEVNKTDRWGSVTRCVLLIIRLGSVLLSPLVASFSAFFFSS